MDELVRHCLRELSFDGDLGCDVSRLRDFIVDFYAHPFAASNIVAQGGGQNVDDAFCAFVWSVIVQQPNVRVGTVPQGASTEVYIAPQASAIKKGKGKAVDAGDGDAAQAAALDIIPDASIRSLEDLKNQYGDRLRIAVDPETTFAALIGSHIRPSKLTPMIYTGLQIITRGREEGVSVLDLGKKSGYDQKTCFYIIKQLVELGLVLKLRRPGISTNFCVHKYFYERSPIWQQVAEEEKKAVSEAQAQEEEAAAEDDQIDEDETKPFELVHFDPIDSRHLSSMPLLKARLTKLLKSCPHYMHTSNNILLKISLRQGFVNPTRTDRRFFLTRLRELMEQGFIEKPPTEFEAALTDDDTGLKSNVSLQRQIIDLLAESGTKGMTLNEISATLGDFDRRTIDLLLNRLEKDPPPSHLADLGVAQLGETHGRERRYKYYTVANYLALADREGFEDQRYRDVDMSHVGEFLEAERDAFFEREEELASHVAALTATKREGPSTTKAKKKRVNPILADGSVKKGRPRKHPLAEGTPASTRKGKKRKREEPGNVDFVDGGVTAEGMEEPPAKKKRGRPPKTAESPTMDTPAVADEPVERASATPSVAKRKGGRPPKKVVEADVEERTPVGAADGSGRSNQTPALKRRGRPPKKTRAAVTEEDVFGPLPQSDEAAASADIAKAANGLEDVPQIDAMPSSPLSSLPASPLRALSPIPAERAAHPLAAETTDVVPVEGDERREISAAENSSVALRRSARTPKIRKRGDSLSPARSGRLPRRGRQATTSANVEKLQEAPVVVPSTAAGLQDASIDQISAPTDGVSAISALESVVALQEGPQSWPQGSAETHPSDASLAIPIDPALLDSSASGDLSLHEDSLIRMTPEPDIPVAGSSQGIARKRDEPETPLSQPSAKRTKSTQSEGSKFRSKANISQSRRENEIMRLLEEAGGIMNTSCKEFYDAHAALVDTITKAGEIASTRPGARIDKRTLETTLSTLESKGKVRIVTTVVPNPTGSSRPIRVVYLPETPPEQLTAFLTGLSENVQPVYVPNLKTLDEPLAYGGVREKSQAKPHPSIALKVTEDQQQLEANAAQLFQRDEQTIRDTLLTERYTVAQLYGYIVGKAARAKALHMLTVELFEAGVTSTQIVSQSGRIIDLSYYYTDLPVSAYCSLVAVSQPNDELGKLLQSPEGRDTPVKDLPDSVRNALAPSQSKSRARILSLLDMLRTLDLATPLVPTDSPNPAVTCAPLHEHPGAYNIAASGPYTPSTAPVHWKFSDIAPIRLWAIPHGLPSVWKLASVATKDQAAGFWSDLEKASTEQGFAEGILGAVPPPPEDAPHDVVLVAKTLRRSISWSATYNLSWYQTEYLRQFIDPATGHTPLEDEDGAEEQLEKFSSITSASKDAIVAYFSKARKRHLRDLKKVQARAVKGKLKAGDDAGAVLARRAAEAKEQRERDWEEMLHRVHPEELSPPAAQRIQRLKAKFMQGAGKPTSKWEGRIVDAIREAEMVTEKLLPAAVQTSVLPPMPVAKPVLPAPAVTAAQEKDVDELIAAQGPRAQQEARTKKSKKGKDKDTGGQTPRRHRFLWNRDYDELARDASVIIKARCRGGTRLDWGALEQVFPAVPRNSVRQRLVHLRETPGMETYLARLEDKWYELWMQHRGTEVLPDPDPESATNFDLATHIKFLRKHIDKNAIRVGFVEVQDSQKTVLPRSIEELEQLYDIVEKVPTAPHWDFMWSVVAEEGREKQFAQHAFIAELLKGVGEEPVRIATTELLNRGVLAKVVRDPAKSKPGRTLKISDNNLNTLGGQLPREVFQDAAALEELVNEQEDLNQWQEWSLLASDGDAAFLIELASENKASSSPFGRIEDCSPESFIIDWNSKKADDDDIETDIRVRYDLRRPVPEPLAPELATAASDSLEEIPIDPSLQLEHGKKSDGERAFCRRSSDGLVDCPACIQEVESACLQELSQDERIVAENVLALLRHAGPAGLSKQRLQADLEPFSPTAVRSVIRRMTDAVVPLAYWTGYAAIVLVAATHIKPWTVTVTGPEDAGMQSIVFPHRWLDIYGRKLNDVWDAATRAIVGLILLRPGISQVSVMFTADLFRRLLTMHHHKAEIRWRLRSVYDRQDVLEIVQALQEDGYICPRSEMITSKFVIGPADDEEERVSFWFLTAGGRKWYQV
ncbi:hypothetical protein BN946_scf184942.g16 [Trametes cinnabarina]|uniref:Uncharacterized protein n=1 Tax=Pycnoporus cinnabarinus TaxID=5643 RepID=A0A060S7I8_PYCCI|nr:hypothetical protein BN946_scf184942.g16 [Trametes cinnabarina]